MVVSSLPESRAQVTPQVEKDCTSLLHGWQSGKISYQETVEKLDRIRAAHAGKPADEGYAELINGIMQGYRGNLDASIQHFEQARDLMLKVGNREQVTRCTLNLGETYRLKGNFARALQYFKAAYETALEIGHRPIQLIARSNEGQMLISMKRYEQAQSILLECYHMAHEIVLSPEAKNRENGWKDNLCSNALYLAEIYLELGHIDEAWRYTVEGYSIAQSLGLPMELGRANSMMGEVLTERQLPETSDDDIDAYFQKATAAFRELKMDGEIGNTMYAHGKSLAKRGKRGLAARKLQQAVIIFTKLGMVNNAAKAAELQLQVL